MTWQMAQSAAHAMLDAIETDLGASPVMYLRSGAPPADCGTADSGTLISTIAMSADSFNAAGSWEKAIPSALQDASADNAGTLGHWRIKTSGGTTKHQGTITATGGGGDLTVDNTSVVSPQVVNVTAWGVTEAGA